VPAPLRHAVLRAHGVDVGAVPVHRGAVAERLTSAYGTRALTQNQEVFLPGRLGPLDRPPADAILAHELTHVVQQRRLGHFLPAEDSAAGRHLEAEAQGAAVSWRADGVLGSPRALIAPHTPEVAGTDRREVEAMIAAALEATGLTVERAASTSGSTPAPSLTSSSVQRENGEGPGAGSWTSGEPLAADDVWPPHTLAPVDAQAERPAGAWTPRPQPPAAQPATLPEIDLDLLARRVCQQVRSELRSELLVDRERSGLLVDR
jgi:hypothetical protein